LDSGFGKPTPRDRPAKESIFPRDGDPDTAEITALYRKTHSSYLPGEMVDRSYKWPESIAADEHFRFGLTEIPEPGTRGKGVKNALSGSGHPNSYSGGPTRIVKMTSEHYRQVCDDPLGANKNLMQANQPVPPGHTYGVSSGTDTVSAGQLIQGYYAEDEQMPDDDLGRCTVVGRRNHVTERHLGVPTIRSDMEAHPPERRSITCSTNFGDDLSAYGLICPNKFQFRGVSDKDFQVRRSRGEMQRLFEGAGRKIAAEDFDMLFDTALELIGDGQELVSLELLMSMYAHWASGGSFR
jgi:hypothetical protein